MSKPNWTRSSFTLAAAAFVAGGPLATRARAADAEVVRIGVVGAVSDGPIYIAEHRGYFREEGIAPEYQTFQSAAVMVAPLGSGQLDVGAGGTSAGLFNAVARGIDMRIVADKASDPPGYGFAPFLVRTELLKSGKYKTLKDIKGMKVAISAPGSSSWPELNAVTDKAGIPFGDVKPISLDYPEHLVALRNGSVDASVTIEPFATLAIKSGSATKILSSDEYYPNQEVAVLIYSGKFLKNRELGMRFMRAYIKGVRVYNDALANGRFAGPASEEVVKILSERTRVKNLALYKDMTPNGVDPNGRVNVASMNKDLAFYKKVGLVTGNIANASVTYDPTFAEQVVKELGLYKPARK